MITPEIVTVGCLLLIRAVEGIVSLSSGPATVDLRDVATRGRKVETSQATDPGGPSKLGSA